MGPFAARSAADGVDPAGRTRSIHLRIAVPDNTYVVDVLADTTTHEVRGATVDGVDLATRAGTPTEPWGWGFRYAGPPSDGIDLTLHAEGSGPLRVRVVTTAPGLPAAVGAPRLPADISWAGWPALSGQTIAVRTFTF